MAIREELSFLNVMYEITDFLPVKTNKPTFYCTVWKDNCKFTKVSENPKFTPRTKHITSKYHYFREFVPNGKLAIVINLIGNL